MAIPASTVANMMVNGYVVPSKNNDNIRFQTTSYASAQNPESAYTQATTTPNHAAWGSRGRARGSRAEPWRARAEPAESARGLGSAASPAGSGAAPRPAEPTSGTNTNANAPAAKF